MPGNQYPRSDFSCSTTTHGYRFTLTVTRDGAAKHPPEQMELTARFLDMIRTWTGVAGLTKESPAQASPAAAPETPQATGA